MQSLPFRLRVCSIQKAKPTNWQLGHAQLSPLYHERPVHYPRELVTKLAPLPALTEWVQTYNPQEKLRSELHYENLLKHADVTVPLERTLWADRSGAEQENGNHDVKSFERFEAPLSFFLEWTKQKLANPSTFSPNETLYIAQCAISNLPTGLQADLPAPPYYYNHENKQGELEHFGMGQDNVDSSSIWMGIPPTETPLHRDPNHNFFTQIAGKKRVRIIHPTYGKFLLSYVKREIASRGGKNHGLALSMRGDEMMVGLERKMMTDIIWSAVDEAEESGEELPSTDPIREPPSTRRIDCLQADVGPGEALHIPESWYHSIRSIGTHSTGINISANWWFRKRSNAEKKRQ